MCAPTSPQQARVTLPQHQGVNTKNYYQRRKRSRMYLLLFEGSHQPGYGGSLHRSSRYHVLCQPHLGLHEEESIRA